MSINMQPGSLPRGSTGGTVTVLIRKGAMSTWSMLLSSSKSFPSLLNKIDKLKKNVLIISNWKA